MSMLKVIQAAAVVAAVLVLPAKGLAQTDGRFTGTVLDPSGASIPGATVVVKNEKTGEERTVTSNAEGRYTVGNLKPSSYTLRIKFGSFAPIEYTDLTLVVGQEFNLDVTMQAAGVSETITVNAQTSTVDLSSAKVGVNVGQREIDGLPLNGRAMSQLALQAPGAVNMGTGNWQEIRFSGRSYEQNAIRFDGVEASAIIDAAPGVANGELQTPFKLQASLENVQEFRIESSVYPAESGTGTGGQINVITKSGSNSLRGSVFAYNRNDNFDSPNYFDTANGLSKSQLKLNQFGGSVGGPIAKDRAFFFTSYEGYRVDAGLNLIEYVPSDAAWARAVPAIAALRPAFLAPGAVLLPGASPSPDFDVAQYQGLNRIRENTFSARVDFRLNGNWNSYVRVSHDQGTADTPETVAGRVLHIEDNPTNAIFNLQGLLGEGTINEFKVGYNHVPTAVSGVVPVVNGVDLSSSIINLTGGLANVGIAGQGATSGVAVPGGLVRSNSNTNGRAQPYDPFSFTLVDSLSHQVGSHYTKLGGEARIIRMSTDRLGGITYAFPNVTAFLANQPNAIQLAGDLSAPSPFNNGATGERHAATEYYIAYAQDEWHLGSKATVNYGLRYEYYTPLRERDDLQVNFNIDTGVIDPPSDGKLIAKKNNILPRVAFTYAPAKTVFKTGFGIFVGPGQTEDQIQPIESDRVSTAVSTGTYPLGSLDSLVANFVNNPNTRSYQPRAYANDYSFPERIYQYTASVQQDLGKNFSATVGYVGSQGRNLFLRSVANNITQVITNANPANAAIVVREFSIPIKDASGNITGVQNPYGEIDYKTSGGHDSYNAMIVSASRRGLSGLSLNAQYTLGKSKGNTGGSNDAQSVGNNARAIDEFDYDNGFNAGDVRHTYNLSAIYTIPYGRGQKYGTSGGAMPAIFGNWEVGGIINGRSGTPVEVLITRPDVVYRDATGAIFANPAADRVAIINTPRGGSFRDRRRPDLVPGVDPYVKDGGLVFLNPAAFATPQPGTFGNLERNSLHGPNFKQTDMFFSKHIPFAGGGRNLELRAEVFNVFNTANFANPVGRLPQAIPTTALSEANRVQPGQPYTAASAGAFGKITSTVGRTVGLGTARQVQFGMRVSF